MAGPLNGLRALDLTRYQQGPYATSLLSDLGVDVIKIEPRPDGEWGRQAERDASGYSPYFETYNRGKRSLSLNIRTPAGRDLLLRLARDADLLVENFRPGYLDGIGLGYDDVRAVNAAIIYASASAYGSQGPLAGRPGYDHIAQAVCGLMIEQAGGPGKEPVPALPGATDQFGAAMFALGITAALVARERTGVGQHVEVSLLGSTLALQGRQVARYLKTGKQGRASARRSPLYSHYRTADGWIAIAAHHPRNWRPLCEALGARDLIDDERFSGPWERFRNADALESRLETIFAARTTNEWLSALVDHDVACGAVHDYATLFAEPMLRAQIAANEYVIGLDDPSGAAESVAVPIRYSAAATDPPHAAPELGEHTESILLEAGLDWPAIEALRRDEVI
jgi:crotonobetainyl-CoA:carnitine CoA-transferase CaiB-like acyl-CoA transferase